MRLEVRHREELPCQAETQEPGRGLDEQDLSSAGSPCVPIPPWSLTGGPGSLQVPHGLSHGWRLEPREAGGFLHHQDGRDLGHLGLCVQAVRPRPQPEGQVHPPPGASKPSEAWPLLSPGLFLPQLSLPAEPALSYQQRWGETCRLGPWERAGLGELQHERAAGGTLLAVQWLRFCPPMQGAWVQSLVGELGSTCLSVWLLKKKGKKVRLD